MIKLRNLKRNDSFRMVDFTNDLDTKINTNFLNYSKSIQDFKIFIFNSLKDKRNIHYAIDSEGEYAGTVSLKNINFKNKKSEFAIVVHPKFRGKGIGKQALILILKKAQKIGLDEVFLNVFEDNLKAILLYTKVGFIKYFTSHRKNLFQNQTKKLIWMKKKL
jgi:diamine N-acetyltransferase